MISTSFLQGLADSALAGRPIADVDALRILDDPSLPLDETLAAAFRVRERHFGRKVRIHILQNVQNGSCPEDCTYCAQASSSRAPIESWSMRSDEEILEGARQAHASGAYRFCVVLSGRGPGTQRVERFAGLVREIKRRWPIEVCVSAGIIDRASAQRLKDAGLDRYNHNLNTSESRYGRICTTHAYADRLGTLEAARSVGLEVCSGIIVGMGESPEDIVQVARELRRLEARSIPVNFYTPIPGAALGEVNQVTPEYALRALCLFRFLNPDAEIRAAGGRERHLGADDARCLLPANSIFAEGYLNTAGDTAERTTRMITAAGFEIEAVERD